MFVGIDRTKTPVHAIRGLCLLLRRGVPLDLATFISAQATMRSPTLEERVMKIRRVVTGHDGHGKSVFVSDTEVNPITVQAMPGAEFHRLWGGDRAPRFPDDGARPQEATYFPPIGGYRFGMFTLPPSTQAASPVDAANRAASQELNEKLPGLADYMEADAPGMH